MQLGRLLADDSATLTAGTLPTGARDLLEQRLAALPTDERPLLVAAAVGAGPSEPTTWPSWWGALVTEVEAGLVRAAGLRIVERAAGTGAWVSCLVVLLSAPRSRCTSSTWPACPGFLTAGDGGDALDRRAITAYKQRVAELAEEQDDADAAHDLARAERARTEYDTLVEQLTRAVGLGGRRRTAGPEPIERLRKAVSARLHDAIGRIEEVHPTLGRHLTKAVHTGIYCAYRPETPTVWRCEG